MHDTFPCVISAPITNGRPRHDQGVGAHSTAPRHKKNTHRYLLHSGHNRRSFDLAPPPPFSCHPPPPLTSAT